MRVISFPLLQLPPGRDRAIAVAEEKRQPPTVFESECERVVVDQERQPFHVLKGDASFNVEQARYRSTTAVVEHSLQNAQVILALSKDRTVFFENCADAAKVLDLPVTHRAPPLSFPVHSWNWNS